MPPGRFFLISLSQPGPVVVELPKSEHLHEKAMFSLKVKFIYKLLLFSLLNLSFALQAWLSHGLTAHCPGCRVWLRMRRSGTGRWEPPPTSSRNPSRRSPDCSVHILTSKSTRFMSSSGTTTTIGYDYYHQDFNFYYYDDTLYHYYYYEDYSGSGSGSGSGDYYYENYSGSGSGDYYLASGSGKKTIRLENILVIIFRIWDD